MTTPASGAIATSNINDETGRGTTTQTGIDWISANTKGNPTDYNSYHNKAWFQSNKDGNCGNGNCGATPGGGNIQCTNCSVCTALNCTNCDGQSYLQDNCNCACTYNCDVIADQAYNCNCACNCNCFVCACACW